MSKTTSHFSLSAIIDQLSKIWKAIFWGIVVSLGGAGFTVFVGKITGTSMRTLAKDPAELIGFSPYVGMLSYWGVILWITTAVICLFSAVLLREYKASGVETRFLAVSGAFSLLLGVDDLYMLHDRLLPRLFHLPEAFFYLLYFLAFTGYLVFLASRILKYDYLLLATAFIFFVISRGFFVWIPYFGEFYATADVLKCFGIVFWLIFFYRTALQEFSALFAFQRQSQTSPPEA
jgi:hypothetical protein